MNQRITVQCQGRPADAAAGKGGRDCLARNTPQGVQELVRLPFTPARVQKVRIFADLGGRIQPRSADQPDSGPRVEIAGGTHEIEPPRPGVVVVAGLGEIGFIAIGLVGFRFRSGRLALHRRRRLREGLECLDRSSRFQLSVLPQSSAADEGPAPDENETDQPEAMKPIPPRPAHHHQPRGRGRLVFRRSAGDFDARPESGDPRFEARMRPTQVGGKIRTF